MVPCFAGTRLHSLEHSANTVGPCVGQSDPARGGSHTGVSQGLPSGQHAAEQGGRRAGRRRQVGNLYADVLRTCSQNLHVQPTSRVRFGSFASRRSKTQSVAAPLLVETERVQGKISAVKHVIQQRCSEEHASHVLLGPCPVRFLCVEQEAGASRNCGPVSFACFKKRDQRPRGLYDLTSSRVEHSDRSGSHYGARPIPRLPAGASSSQQQAARSAGSLGLVPFAIRPLMPNRVP